MRRAKKLFTIRKNALRFPTFQASPLAFHLPRQRCSRFRNAPLIKGVREHSGEAESSTLSITELTRESAMRGGSGRAKERLGLHCRPEAFEELLQIRCAVVSIRSRRGEHCNTFIRFTPIQILQGENK